MYFNEHTMTDGENARNMNLEGGIPHPDQRTWGEQTRNTGYLYLPSSYYESPDGQTEATLAPLDTDYDRNIASMDRAVARMAAAGITDILSSEAIDMMIQEAIEESVS